MTAPLNPAFGQTLPSPIMTAVGWLEGIEHPAARPLINLAQAAPSETPPLALREVMAEAVLNQPSAHLYGAVLGDDALRAEIAAQWSAAYQGNISPAQVGVTSGCNQAYATAIATLVGSGDEVILPTPWYFNHKMWLDMQGGIALPLPTGADCLPDIEAAAALITPRTRAIALVSPNNPTGAEYPASLLNAFFELCEAGGIALILDETYRDFDSRPGPVHSLFARPGWDETLIHLYSFSKAYRLTGHRIGAMITSPARLAEAEKFLDTVTICPSRIGQIAALHGLRTQSAFVAGERAEFLARRAALEETFAAGVGGWTLLGCGAYFAYLRHPFAMRSDILAQRLVREQSLLILPGTFFTPDGDPTGAETVRVAFANVDTTGIGAAMARLAAFRP